MAKVTSKQLRLAAGAGAIALVTAEAKIISLGKRYLARVAALVAGILTGDRS